MVFLASVATGAVAQRPRASVPLDGDASVFALIERLRPRAARIALDGKDADWRAFPTFADPPGDARGDASRDLVETSIAPRGDDLLLRMVTAGRPSQDDRTFWFNLDIWGTQATDFQFGLSRDGPDVLWVFDSDGNSRSVTIDAAQVAIADVVEVRLPYSVLARFAPGVTGDAARHVKRRPWIRVSPFTWNSQTRRFVDYGASVASFLLIRTPYELHPPLRASNQPPLALELPVNGQWYIGQGAFGTWTHHNTWSYDLYIVDHTLHPSRVRDSRRNEEYYSWGEPIFAPTRARVIRVRSDTPDGIPPKRNPAAPRPNEVYLDINGKVGLWLAHFRQGDVVVVPGRAIPKGTVLGHTGNSGSSAWPHLHMALWQLPQGRMTLPLALADVRVSLNPSPDDPWSRDLAIWEPSEGFFVQRLP